MDSSKQNSIDFSRLIVTRRRTPAVSIIVTLNVIVFALWYLLDLSRSHFMEDNFVVSWSLLQEGRWWILLTAAFSHNMIWHILINMLVLRSFGPLLENILGTRSFVIFYLIASIVSSFTHAFVSAFVLGTPDLPAIGASGAIAGLVLVFSLMFPRQKILIFGIVPLPAIWGALVFIGLDLWGLIAQAGGGGLPIGHGAHLGGAFTGIVYFFLFVRGHSRKVERIP